MTIPMLRLVAGAISRLV